MQLHDLGSHTTKVVVRVKFLRASVASGKGWLGRGTMDVPSLHLWKKKPTGAKLVGGVL